MRNILTLISLTLLVGCQTTSRVIVKEEKKEAEEMDNQKETCLTIENFNLLKNYILKNGKDDGSNFGVFYVEISNFYLTLTTKVEEEDISIVIDSLKNRDNYSFKLYVYNNELKWDYLCIPLTWNYDFKKKELQHYITEIMKGIKKKEEERQ